MQEFNFKKLDFGSSKPLSVQAASILEQKIKDNEIPVNHKLPSQEELSRLFNVSIDTIKEALSILSKEGYISSRRKLGTYVINSDPLKAVDLKRKNLIGHVFCPSSKASYLFINKGYHVVTAGVEEKTREHSMNLLYKVMDGNELDFGDMKNNIAGLIATGILTTEKIKKIQGTKYPLVLIGDPYEKEKAAPGIDVVSNDDFQKVEVAASHLLELGHRKIVYAGAYLDRHSWQIDMFRAYKETLAREGIEYDEKLAMELKDFDESRISGIFSEYLEKNAGFTGIICMSHTIYDGVMRALAGRNIRVPEDISVVACDHVPENVTQVNYDLREMGSTAVDLLYSRFTNPAREPRRILIPSRLSVGSTTRLIQAAI